MVSRKLMGVIMNTPCSIQSSSGMTDATHLTLGSDLGGGQPNGGVGVGALLALAHLARLPPGLHLLLQNPR